MLRFSWLGVDLTQRKKASEGHLRQPREGDSMNKIQERKARGKEERPKVTTGPRRAGHHLCPCGKSSELVKLVPVRKPERSSVRTGGKAEAHTVGRIATRIRAIVTSVVVRPGHVRGSVNRCVISRLDIRWGANINRRFVICMTSGITCRRVMVVIRRAIVPVMTMVVRRPVVRWSVIRRPIAAGTTR